jgi:hypothetical protein
LLQFAVRNVANYSPAVLPLDPGQPDEWEVLARRGPERVLDLMLQAGPYEASLDLLVEHPHGVDFGALEPRVPEVLQTPSGLIELDHPALMDDLVRLADSIAELGRRGPVLVGRRHLRSNNSWMHNIEVLVKGAARCTLQVHPDDAHRWGLTDGGQARVTSRVGSVVAPVEVTEVVRPGVVSLPHGWGHDAPGAQLGVASRRAGVNSNVLSDDEALDPLSGTSVLNGIPVEVVAV